MLEIKNLHFGYSKKTPVLQGLDLKLQPGEVGTLLGKNGSGKTTLFKNLIGACKPKKGIAELEGKNLFALSGRERAKLVAYVPQSIEFGDLSVFDSVLSGRIAYFSLAADKKDIAVAERVIKEMGLSSIAHRNVNELSGGERQKVAIARAMAQEPLLMVFDEPTGNLDIANEQLIIREAKRLAKEKNIAVLSSVHDLNEALSFGDKFFFLKDGVIKYAGGKEIVTEEVILDVFDAEIHIETINNRKVILGGDFYEH